MRLHLKAKNVRVPNIGDFGVLLGETFDLVVRGSSRFVSWSATNDEVLSIGDDGRPRARITATAVGMSHLIITDDRTHQTLEIDIAVFAEEAARFKMPAPVVEPMK